MKNKLHSLLVLIASSAVSSAAIVSYPSLNTTLITQGGTGADDTESVTTAISVAPNHTWIDNNSGGAPFSQNVYFGGSISFAPETANGDAWNSGINYLLRIDGTNVVRLRAGNGSDGWRFQGDNSTATIVGYPRASSFDFVIKLEDTAWNIAVAKIFLGANANNATEGTPDYTVELVNRNVSPINTIVFNSTTANGTGGAAISTATLSSAFSSTEWTPVSAVPEPSHYAALLALVALAFGFVRRRNSK